MVQVPTDSNVAGLNAKPLGGQRIRYLMNLIGFWQSEDQTRVGEHETSHVDDMEILVS